MCPEGEVLVPRWASRRRLAVVEREPKWAASTDFERNHKGTEKKPIVLKEPCKRYFYDRIKGTECIKRTMGGRYLRAVRRDRRRRSADR